MLTIFHPRPLTIFLIALLASITQLGQAADRPTDSPTDSDSPIAFYYADNIREAESGKFYPTLGHMQDQFWTDLQSNMGRFINEDLTFSEVYHIAREFFKKEINIMRSFQETLARGEKREIWIGFARMRPPQADRFQDANMGFGSEQRIARVFKSLNDSTFINDLNTDLGAVVFNENNIFEPYHSTLTNQDWNLDGLIKLRRGNLSYRAPYFLGDFMKLIISRDNLVLKVQIAMGLRPVIFAVKQASGLVFIENLMIPMPSSKETAHLGPIALIDLTFDKKALSQSNPKLPLKIRFGSIGSFENGALTTAAGPSTFEGLMDRFIWHQGIRKSDIVPRMTGHLTSTDFVSIDLNITELNISLRPGVLLDRIKESQESLGQFVDAQSLASMGDIVNSVFKNTIDLSESDLIKIESSDLLLTPGFGPFTRLFELPGTLGNANQQFTDGMNENITQQLKTMSQQDLWTLADSYLSGFLKKKSLPEGRSRFAPVSKRGKDL